MLWKRKSDVYVCFPVVSKWISRCRIQETCQWEIIVIRGWVFIGISLWQQSPAEPEPIQQWTDMAAIVMESSAVLCRETHVHQGTMKGLIIIVVSASSSSCKDSPPHVTPRALSCSTWGHCGGSKNLNAKIKRNLFSRIPILSCPRSSHYHLSAAASCASPWVSCPYSNHAMSPLMKLNSPVRCFTRREWQMQELYRNFCLLKVSTCSPPLDRSCCPLTIPNCHKLYCGGPLMNVPSYYWDCGHGSWGRPSCPPAPSRSSRRSRRRRVPDWCASPPPHPRHCPRPLPRCSWRCSFAGVGVGAGKGPSAVGSGNFDVVAVTRVHGRVCFVGPWLLGLIRWRVLEGQKGERDYY